MPRFNPTCRRLIAPNHHTQGVKSAAAGNRPKKVTELCENRRGFSRPFLHQQTVLTTRAAQGGMWPETPSKTGRSCDALSSLPSP